MPTIAHRIAQLWFRRARETSEIDRFLKALGTKKVKSPSTGNEVQLNTLHGSDEPADRELFKKEFDKWKSSTKEDEDGDAFSVSQEYIQKEEKRLKAFAKELGLDKDEAEVYIDKFHKLKDKNDVQQIEDAIRAAADAKKEPPKLTPEQFEAEKNKLIEYATKNGLTDDEAHALVDELKESDGVDAINAVGAKLFGAAKAKRKKEDDNRKKEEEANAEKKRIDNIRESLLEKAYDAGMSVKDAKALLENINTNMEDEQSAIGDVEKEITKYRRDAVKNKPKATSQAVDAAKAKLDEAKKSRDADAIKDAQTKLNEAKDAHRDAELKSWTIESEDFELNRAAAETEAEQARADINMARHEIEDAQQRIDELKEADGDNTDEISRLEADIRAAQKTIVEHESRVREIQTVLDDQQEKHNIKMRDMFQKNLDASWEHAEKNRGILLYDANGNATRYDPGPQDEVYNYMVALLGEQIEKRNLPEVDTSSSYDEEDESPKGNRNPDGSSVSGRSLSSYGPGEFWKVNSKKWGGKDSSGDISYFDNIDAARNYATGGKQTKPKPKSKPKSKTARVADRYLWGNFHR